MGKVHFGDVVMLVNPKPKDCSRGECALSLDVSDTAMHAGGAVTSCPLTGSSNVAPSARNAFKITRYSVILCLLKSQGEFLKFLVFKSTYVHIFICKHISQQSL